MVPWLPPPPPAPHALCRLESVGFAETFFSRPGEVVEAERIFYQEIKMEAISFSAYG